MEEGQLRCTLSDTKGRAWSTIPTLRVCLARVGGTKDGARNRKQVPRSQSFLVGKQSAGRRTALSNLLLALAVRSRASPHSPPALEGAGLDHR